MASITNGTMEKQRCRGVFAESINYWMIFVWLVAATSWFLSAQQALSQGIFVNQVGYPTLGPKIAMVSSPIGLPFTVIDAENGSERFQGQLRLRASDCSISGGNVWLADFSSLEQPGDYRIRAPGIGESPTFRIGGDQYSSLLRQSIRAFYWLRSGLDLDESYAKEWARENLSPPEAVIYSSDNATPTVVTVSGGWHDGSDLGRYTPSGAYAAGMLMLIYELFPESELLGDGSFNIPESGNGIPDILDEARWKLEWLMRAQTEEGGFYHKLTPIEPLPLNAESKQTRYLYPPATASTASACAALAKASRLYSPYDATFAAECFDSATRAWRYLEHYPENQPFTNPPDTRTRAYSDSDDTDERFWAALELYLATEESLFQDIALAIAEKRLPLLSASGYWGNVMPLAAGTVLALPDSSLVSSSIQRELERDVLNLAESLRVRVEDSSFFISLRPGEFTWGSNAILLQNVITMLLAHRVDSNAGYESLAMDQIHYVLGRNPLSICFVTGFGELSPKRPFQFSLLGGRADRPFPGLLVGGSNETLNDAVLKRFFTDETPSALAYIDDAESFASNEFSLEWNAALAFVAAWFSSGYSSESQ